MRWLVFLFPCTLRLSSDLRRRADDFQGVLPHLLDRCNFVVVAKAPIDKLTALAKKKGWNFKFISSQGNSFNRDFGVEFTKVRIVDSAL